MEGKEKRREGRGTAGRGKRRQREGEGRKGCPSK